MRPSLVLAALPILLSATTASADLPNATQIAEARQIVTARPADPQTRLRLVELLVRAPAPDEALSEIALFEALHPTDTRAAYWRARALLGLGRAEEAEGALDERIEDEPLDATSLGLRARLRAERGAYQDAIADYDDALVRSSNVELFLGRARAQERLGALEDARRGLDQGLRRTAGAVVLRRYAYSLARRSGDHAAALAHADAVLALSPRATQWRVMRAAALTDAGQADLARAELERALADAEAQLGRRASALAQMERGRVLLALGRRDDALHDLQAAVARAPALTEARRLLGAARGSR